MTAVIISILLWTSDVTFGYSEAAARRGHAARAIVPIQVMKDARYRAKTRVKARATLMDVKTNYESGR